MTLDALIMGAGAFVAVLSFLGFPGSWDRALFLIAGIFIVGLGIAVRRGAGKMREHIQHATQYSQERDHGEMV